MPKTIAITPIIASIFFLFSVSAFGQAVRYDQTVTTINQSAPLPGGMYPVLALPGATVQICATWTVGTAACNSLATTYTTINEAATCPSNAQLYNPLATQCSSTVDSAGGWGVYVAPGSYAYVVTVPYGTFGPYPFTAGGGGVGTVAGPSFAVNFANSGVTAFQGDSNILITPSSHAFSVGTNVLSPTQGACLPLMGQYNVKCYGAKGDVRSVTDAAVSGTSMTSATANFTSADTGKSVSVPMGTEGLAFVTSPITGITASLPSTFNGSIAAGAGGGALSVLTVNNLASFTGSISGTTLTVSGVTGTIAAGQSLYDGAAGLVAAGTTIISGSGTTWTVSVSQTVTSEAMVTSGTKLAVGQTIYGSGVLPGTSIAAQLTGTAGEPGTYSLNSGVTFTGSISNGSGGAGNTLVVIGLTSPLAVGDIINGPGVTAGTTITGGSGTTWTVNGSAQNVANEAMTAVVTVSAESMSTQGGGTCSMTGFNGGGTGATADLWIGVGNVVLGPHITNAGTGFTAAPTTATVTSNTAYCSGTPAFTSTIAPQYVATTITYVNSTTATMATSATTPGSALTAYIGTDDTTAIQNADNAATGVFGAYVYFPPGTYFLSTLTLSPSVGGLASITASLEGAGQGVSTLQQIAPSGPVITVDPSGPPDVFGASMSNFTINGASSFYVSGNDGIDDQNINAQQVINKVEIAHMGADGINSPGNVNFFAWRDSYIHDLDWGWAIYVYKQTYRTAHGSIDNIRFTATQSGLELNNVDNVTVTNFSGGDDQFGTSYGPFEAIHIEQCNVCLLLNPYIEWNYSSARILWMGSDKTSVVKGGSFTVNDPPTAPPTPQTHYTAQEQVRIEGTTWNGASWANWQTGLDGTRIGGTAAAFVPTAVVVDGGNALNSQVRDYVSGNTLNPLDGTGGDTTIESVITPSLGTGTYFLRQFKGGVNGGLSVTGGLTADSETLSGLLTLTQGSGTAFRLRPSGAGCSFDMFDLNWNGVMNWGPCTGSVDTILSRTLLGPGLAVTPTNTQTSGAQSSFFVHPTYNQASGTAANTDILDNRVETALGSGAQLLADFQVSGVSKFKVDHTGNVTAVGALTSANQIAAGTQSISGCSLTSAVGGAQAGSFASGTSGTCTVTITPGITAPHGWTCAAHDLTTVADVITQTSTSTTACIIAGTTVSADVITWSAIAF